MQSCSTLSRRVSQSNRQYIFFVTSDTKELRLKRHFVTLIEVNMHLTECIYGRAEKKKKGVTL